MAQVSAEVRELAPILSSFRHYPPSQGSVHGGNCHGCLVPVGAGAGWVAMGSDNGGVFAVVLCDTCTSGVRTTQQQTGR